MHSIDPLSLHYKAHLNIALTCIFTTKTNIFRKYTLNNPLKVGKTCEPLNVRLIAASLQQPAACQVDVHITLQ